MNYVKITARLKDTSLGAYQTFKVGTECVFKNSDNVCRRLTKDEYALILYHSPMTRLCGLNSDDKYLSSWENLSDYDISEVYENIVSFTHISE